MQGSVATRHWREVSDFCAACVTCRSVRARLRCTPQSTGCTLYCWRYSSSRRLCWWPPQKRAPLPGAAWWLTRQACQPARYRSLGACLDACLFGVAGKPKPTAAPDLLPCPGPSSRSLPCCSCAPRSSGAGRCCGRCTRMASPASRRRCLLTTSRCCSAGCGCARQRRHCWERWQKATAVSPAWVCVLCAGRQPRFSHIPWRFAASDVRPQLPLLCSSLQGQR